jgi:hypothetical protein
MRRLAVIICSLLITLAAHAQDASVLLPYVTAVEEESGAWSPLSLGSKLACWFDADDSATLLDAGGAPADAAEAVQTWQDKSGNGRHATAPAAAQRPTRQVGVQNGRAVVRTAGAALLNIGRAGAVFRNETAGYIFAVAKDANQAGGATHHIILQWANNSTGSRFSIHGRHTSFSGDGWKAAGRRLDADGAVGIAVGANANHSIIRARADWSGGKLYVSLNSSAEASVAYASGAGSTSDTGSSAVHMLFNMPANSEIAEIVVVNAAMSAGEIAATERYLKDKWGTP